MINATDDLWSQFTEGEKVAESRDEPVVKKSTAKDGSEWSGAFDRRSTPRGEASGQFGLM